MTFDVNGKVTAVTPMNANNDVTVTGTNNVARLVSFAGINGDVFSDGSNNAWNISGVGANVYNGSLSDLVAGDEVVLVLDNTTRLVSAIYIMD